MSRTPRFALPLLYVLWPAPAVAAVQDESGVAVAPTAEAVIRAWRARTDRAMRRRCAQDGAEDEILVCGRSFENERQALPLASQPEAGARRRLIAGEVPRGIDALHATDPCCGHGGEGINILAIVDALGTGLDNILHPD